MLFEFLWCENSQEPVKILIVSEVRNFKTFPQKVLQHSAFLFEMVLCEDLFNFLFRQRWNNNTRMIVCQNTSQPFEVTVPSVDLFVKLGKLYFEGDIISAKEFALVFPKTDNVELN